MENLDMDNDTASQSLVIRRKAIRTDSNGLVCLTDIWTAASGSSNQTPGDWWRNPSSKKLAGALLNRISGKSRNSHNSPSKSVYYSRDRGGTYAHAILACAYAGYLDP